MKTHGRTHYVVHDANGNILRTGTCPDADFELQAREGEFVIEGEADDRKHHVENGKVVARPDPEDEIIQGQSVLPTIQEQLDALWEGGQAEAAMRSRLMAAKQQRSKP